MRSSWYEVEFIDERVENGELILTTRLVWVNHWHPGFWWSLVKAVAQRLRERR